jgi:hypothetical protein
MVDAPRKPRVERLSEALCRVVIKHYRATPAMSREKVYDVLNALAVVTATIISGTEPEEKEARAYFELALLQQFKMLEEHEAELAGEVEPKIH